MKLIRFLLIMVMLASCSSSYDASVKVRKIKDNLSVDEALSILQKNIWPDNKVGSVCGASGFWYDENSDMEVKKEGVSLLSHKRGKVLKQYNQKQIGEVVVFEREYYKYFFDFSKVKEITVYSDYRLLPTFPVCNKKDMSESYIIVDLYISKQSNMKFVVKQESQDELMAALLRLFDKVPVYIK